MKRSAGSRSIARHSRILGNRQRQLDRERGSPITPLTFNPHRSAMHLTLEELLDVNVTSVSRRDEPLGQTMESSILGSRLPSPATPKYFEFDARIGWNPMATVELSAIGRNLLHKRHTEFAQTTTIQAQRDVYGRVAIRF